MEALASMVSKGQTEQAAGAIEKLGINGQQVARFLPGYSKALNKAGNAAASSFRASEIAFKNGGSAATGMKQTGAAASQSANEIAEMTEALYANASASLALSGNAIAVEAAMDAASASVKENGKTLDINTQAGRNNQTALDNLVASTLNATKAMIDQGASAEDVVARNERSKASFIRNADAMGKTKAKATDLADTLFTLPASVTSQIVVRGAKVSAAEAKNLNKALKDVPADTRARIVTIANTKGAKEAQREIAKVKSKTVIAKATGKGVNTVREIDGAIRKLKSKSVRAQANAAGRPAVKALDDAIRKLKDRRVTASASTSGKGGVDALRGSINSLNSKQVTISVYKKTRTVKDGGYIDGFASGGKIRGVGGPREDNIAGIDRATGMQTSWVSAKEFVVNAAATRDNLAQIEAINAGGKWTSSPASPRVVRPMRRRRRQRRAAVAAKPLPLTLTSGRCSVVCSGWSLT